MKKLISLLILFVAVSSCDENDCGCINYQLDANLILKDESGNFLINEENFNQIEISYLVEGNIIDGEEPIHVNEQNLSGIKVFLNHAESEEFPVTYIKWNEFDSDTIKAKFSRNNRVWEKIWINDVEITSFDQFGFYTIVK